VEILCGFLAAEILLMVGVITDHSFSYHDICSQSIVG